MINLSITIQEYSECVCELDSLRFCFESCMNLNIIISEVSVDAYTISMMWLYMISNPVASILSISKFLIYIIWQFILIEDGLSIITIPYNLIFEDMLDSKTVGNDIITIYREASVGWVIAIFNTSSDIMICTPQPCVIDDHVSRVNGDHIICSHLVMPLVSRTSYSGDDIAGNTWILRRSLESSICASPFQKRRWFLWSCIEEDTGNSDTINISDFNTWLSCGWYESGNSETEYDLACLTGLNGIS